MKDLIVRAQKRLARVGQEEMRKIKREVAKAFRELNRVEGVNITELLMGMGTYALKGTLTVIQDDGHDTVTEVDAEDLFEWADKQDFCWKPIALTEKHRRLIQKLDEVFQEITCDNYLPVFDLGPRDLKPKDPGKIK